VGAVLVSVQWGKVAPFLPFAYGQGGGHRKKGKEELILSDVFEVEPLEVVAIGIEVQKKAFDLPVSAVELSSAPGYTIPLPEKSC